jgi:hypothetical protein
MRFAQICSVNIEEGKAEEAMERRMQIARKKGTQGKQCAASYSQI